MLPLNAAQIPKLFEQARVLHDAGNLDKAKEIYRQILLTNRSIVDVHFQLGRIALVQNDPPAALKYFEDARALRPKEPGVWLACAEAVRRLGDDHKARALVRSAKTAGLSARQVMAIQEKAGRTRTASKARIGNADPAQIKAAIAKLQSGDYAGAEAAALALHKRHPKVAVILDILGSAHIGTRRLAEAEMAFQKAIAADPEYAEAYNNYGRFLTDTDRAAEALPHLKRAIELAPDKALAYHNLGVSLQKTKNVEGSFQAFEKALSLAPDDREILTAFIPALLKASRFAKALELAEHLTRLQGDTPNNLVMRAEAMIGHGRYAEAFAFLDRAIAEVPDWTKPIQVRMGAHQGTGDFAAARKDLEALLALEPREGAHYRNYATIEKIAPDDPLLPQMRALYADPETRDEDKVQLAFGLAKAAEDTRDYAAVFPYLSRGSELIRKAHPYDIQSAVDETEAVMEAYRDLDYSADPIPGVSAETPIFVSGLPRSGTTLVEQIIASHPRVNSAGEVAHFSRIAHAALGANATSVISGGALNTGAIAQVGNKYMERLWEDFDRSKLITDKSIMTFRYLGLARLTLPNAKIVILKRDPRDNLLSIYKNIFVEGTHLYSYDLADLALYYKLFNRMVDFWRERLGDWFYEISYEELTSNPEAETRKLIEFCGLEWDDACLNFHQSGQSVKTLSVYQVRQPIYKSSVKSWQRYENELRPLFDALEGD